MSHLKRLLRARAYVGCAMIALSVLQALMWCVPKPVTGLMSLAYVLTGVLLVQLTYRIADPRFPEPRRRIPAFLVVLLMAGLSFLGSFVILDQAQGLPFWMSFTWQLAYITWLPGIVLGMIVRRALVKRIPRAIRKDTIVENREREVLHEQRLQRQINARSAPSAPGRITGFEPARLADVALPELPLLFGSPGAGLAGSRFSADAVSQGIAGELNFARAMAQAGLLSRFATFWSVHMPDDVVGASRATRADIDCVVVTGRSIVLFDVKNYVQGDVTWLIDRGELRMIDNPTGGYVGAPRRMSRNMEFARSRMRAKFDGLGIRHGVDARVVMMPTDDGIGRIARVQWTGGIPVEALDETLGLLGREPDFDPSDTASEYIVRVLRWLVKDHSGSAPLLGAPDAAPQQQPSPAAPSRKIAPGSTTDSHAEGRVIPLRPRGTATGKGR